MTVSTFFPDPDTESTSVDGYSSSTDDTDWDTIHDAAGDAFSDNSVVLFTEVKATNTTDVWSSIRRIIILFDTSALPDSDSIASATLDFMPNDKVDDFSDSLSLVKSTPATNTALVDGDYTQLGTTKQATDLTLASITADNATYNSFVLNAAGLVSISKTAVTKFGMIALTDLSDTEPTWVAGKKTFIRPRAADDTGTTKDPKLIVTHTGGFPTQVASSGVI